MTGDEVSITVNGARRTLRIDPRMSLLDLLRERLSLPGIAGTAAAIGNAVYHATGRRVRDLPFTRPSSSSDRIASKGGSIMARSRRRGLARAGELPGTLKRSSKDAQETFTKAHDNAVQAYGEGDQADRATYTEFKRKFEKRGDHWIPKQKPVPDT